MLEDKYPWFFFRDYKWYKYYYIYPSRLYYHTFTCMKRWNNKKKSSRLSKKSSNSSSWTYPCIITSSPRRKMLCLNTCRGTSVENFHEWIFWSTNRTLKNMTIGVRVTRKIRVIWFILVGKISACSFETIRENGIRIDESFFFFSFAMPRKISRRVNVKRVNRRHGL